MFRFPLEVYAAYLSYTEDLENKINIDRFVVQTFSGPESRRSIREDTLSRTDLHTLKPELFEKIGLYLTDDIISLFKEHGVYFIRRGVSAFSPSDTIPRNIKNLVTGKDMLVKSENQNKSLIIRFDEKVDVVRFAEKLNKLKCIKLAAPQKPIDTYSVPNDP